MADGVILVGLSGSGKSTLGRELATRLNRPFVDTDALVRERTGRSPAAIISEDGETAFRVHEAAALAELPEGSVVATGGGAVEDPVNRWRLWQHGRVVWLDAPDATLASRVAVTEDRPLLGGDAVDGLRRLRARRLPFYRAADSRVDTGGADAINRIQDVLAGSAPSGRRLFDGDFGRHHPIGPAMARIVYGVDLPVPEVEGTPSVVVDRRVANLAPAGTRRLEIVAGERAKRLRTLERILEWLSEVRHERGDPLIAVGGGTTGDIVGLAAALYARGVPWINLPTTWLAQADAALGGKVAVDLAGAKNAVGAFWPPVAVSADVATLRTLNQDQLRDGLAEAAKAAIIGDPALWELLEHRGRAALEGDEEARYAITERAARVKLDIVERDPFEIGERRQLNLGHTLGHALEVESRYRLPHGAAVALGLRAVATIAARRGADPTLPERLDNLLARLRFTLQRDVDASVVSKALETDKKRSAGRQRWLLPMRIGQVEEVDGVSEAELQAALGRIGP